MAAGYSSHVYQDKPDSESKCSRTVICYPEVTFLLLIVSDGCDIVSTRSQACLVCV